MGVLNIVWQCLTCVRFRVETCTVTLAFLWCILKQRDGKSSASPRTLDEIGMQHLTGASHGSQECITMNEWTNILSKICSPWQLLIKWRFQSETLGSLDSEDLLFCVLVWREDAAAPASWEIAQAYHVQHPLQRPVQTFAKVMPVSHAKSWWEQSQDELGACFVKLLVMVLTWSYMVLTQSHKTCMD